MTEFEALIASRTARYTERRDDWTVFGFETQLDPRFARSQRRYLGASGSVDHQETQSIPATAFTMSVQTMPVGNRIPAHCHETDETFFILDGECVVNVFKGDETVTLELRKWDCVSIPPGIYHDIVNTGAVPCPVQTLLAKPRPDRPHYRDARLLELQAATHTT
jgi:mannose-6-phosphate isomerase-like protein (cupin superfamily)